MIEITLPQLYLGGLLVSLPGVVVSVPSLWVASGRKRWPFCALLAVWLLVLPWGVLWVVDTLSPGILARQHAYSGIEFILRVWLPGTIGLPLLAGIIALFGRKKRIG